MSAGAKALGLPHDLLSSRSYRNRPEHDVAIFYGLANGLRVVFDQYKAFRKAVYIDLGYWKRHKRSRWDGNHKLALNSRHATAYFQARPKPSDRFEASGLTVRPWRDGGNHILVAGMSAKAAACERLGAEVWERRTVAELRKITKRPIIYRPKPNWDGARPIPGSTFGKGQSLEEALHDCHAVVTHHSNVAVDALLAGIPCICPEGVASALSGHALTQIESPPMPDGREQWAYDLAYTQYSVDEMRGGAALRYLLGDGLI